MTQIRQTRYERMARSGDALLREIGIQVGSGQVRPAGLLSVPEYREVIRRGVALLGEASRQHPHVRPSGGAGRAGTPTPP
jgi:hypothetical protein